MKNSPKRKSAAAVNLAIVYKAIPHWRIPVFEGVRQNGTFRTKIFHAKSIANVKHQNSTALPSHSCYAALWTLPLRFRRSGEWVGLPLCPTLLFQLWRFRPDVIVMEGASNVANNLIVVFYATLTRTPRVWWGLGDIPGTRRSGLRRVLYRISRIGERSADVALAYSSPGAAYYRSCGVPEERIVIANNVIDTRSERNAASSQLDESRRIRASLCYPSAPTVLYCGALTKVKGVDLLLRAAKTMETSGLDFNLLIVGSGPEEPTLQEMARECKYVKFAGRRVSDGPAYFGASDIFVMPGLGGLALSQALCHGLPIVSGRADGTAEDMVLDGINGYLLDDVTELALVRSLSRLIRSEQLRADFGAQSKRLVDEGLNIDSYVADFLKGVKMALEFRTSDAPVEATAS